MRSRRWSLLPSIDPSEETPHMEERIIERLRKVLALTNSPAEGEAQAAAAMLAKLLTDHNLSMADLEKKGGQASPGIKKQGHDLGKAAFKWKLDLAEAIAEHYYCHSLVDRETKTVAFVGRPDNVESLQMLYGWIIDQIRRIASDERRVHQRESGEHIDPLRWQVNFGIGAVERLGVRLHEKRAEEQRKAEAAPSGSTALVVMSDARKQEISDYLEKEFGYRIDGQMTALQRKRDEEWKEYLAKQQVEEDARAALLVSDPEEYYRKFPNEHPDEKAKRQAELDKWWAKEKKKEERNLARRTGRYQRETTPEERRQRQQAETATDSGYRSADRVNLNPFLEGKTERKKIG